MNLLDQEVFQSGKVQSINQLALAQCPRFQLLGTKYPKKILARFARRIASFPKGLAAFWALNTPKNPGALRAPPKKPFCVPINDQLLSSLNHAIEKIKTFRNSFLDQ